MFQKRIRKGVLIITFRNGKQNHKTPSVERRKNHFTRPASLLCRIPILLTFKFQTVST
jgi:hypothetical protein